MVILEYISASRSQFIAMKFDGRSSQKLSRNVHICLLGIVISGHESRWQKHGVHIEETFEKYYVRGKDNDDSKRESMEVSVTEKVDERSVENVLNAIIGVLKVSAYRKADFVLRNKQI